MTSILNRPVDELTEEDYRRLSEEADKGAHDQSFAELLEEYAANLPRGYAIRDGKVVRLDPSLPRFPRMNTEFADL
jgi:hypothetical protein